MNPTQVSADFYSAGQISLQDVQSIAAQGFKTIINCRPDGEDGPAQPTAAQIREAAEKCGLHYYHFPVAMGTSGAEYVAAMAAALARAPKPVLGFAVPARAPAICTKRRLSPRMGMPACARLAPMMLFPLLLGLWVGALMALTGAGGAVLAVPLLVIVLHLPVAQAAPIGLMAVVLAAGLGALLGLRAGIVRYKAALLMAGLGLLCAPLGFWLGRRLPDPLLVLLFCLVLLYVAVRMWRFSTSQPDQSLPELTPGQPLTAACQFDPRRGGFAWTAPCARRLMYSGALAGLLSGALGVGGGFVLVPALNKVSNLQMKSVVATSLATTALIAVGSILLAACQQAVAWRLALPFAVAAAVGMLVGRKIAEHCKDKLVQRAFAVFALLVALGMGLKAWLV